MNGSYVKKSHGFTLIELLIVLALITIVSTVVVPKLWGQYRQFQERQQLEKFWAHIKHNSSELRRHGQNFVLDPNNKALQQLASQFKINVREGDIIMTRADGFTRGGELRIEFLPAHHSWLIHVTTPDGVVRFERQ